MGDRSMGEHSQRSSRRDGPRPSSQGCQSCCNGHQALSSSPVCLSNRNASATKPYQKPPAARKRAPTATVLRPERNRPRHPQLLVLRTHINISRRQYRRRPRSKPNTQSGGPIGGDLAVPGDQPASSQEPELRDQLETAQCVRPDVCLTQTSPPPRTVFAHVSSSDSCQRTNPTRWTFFRKNVQKLKESYINLNECTPINIQPPPETRARHSDEDKEEARKSGPNGGVGNDGNDAVRKKHTGFYFGTSARRSWPHSVASAEYFTAVSNRRMKKLEPTSYRDEINTKVELDEDGSEEKMRSATLQQEEEDEQDVNKAANAAALACSVRSKRYSRQQHGFKGTQRSRNAGVSKTARLRRAKSIKASSTRGYVMQDILRKILAIGQRQHRRRLTRIGNRAVDRFKPAAIRSTLGSLSPQRQTLWPNPCAISTSSSSQEKKTCQRNCHYTRKKEKKYPQGQRSSRESLSSKIIPGHESLLRCETYQRKCTERVCHRTCPKQWTISKSSNGNRQKAGSPCNSKRTQRAIKSSASSTKASISFQGTEYSKNETQLISTQSACRKDCDVVKEPDPNDATNNQDHQATETILGKSAAPRTQDKQDFRTNGASDFVNRNYVWTVRERDNTVPNFVASKLGCPCSLNAQLFINRVSYKSTSGSDYQIHTNTGTNNSTLKNIGKTKSKTSHAISDVKSQNENDVLMRCLVQSSVGVQNAVFPHLNITARVSKTTQISTDDLVKVPVGSLEGVIPKTKRASNWKRIAHRSQKCPELPIPVCESPVTSTSRKKTRKTRRLKNMLHVLAKNHQPPKYKFVRTAHKPNPQVPPTSKRNHSQSEGTSNKRRHEVARPKTRVSDKTNPIHEKASACGARNVTAPMSSISLPRVNRRALRASHRIHDAEGYSRSELVSLFHANTTGSSIHSVEISSSNYMLGVKPPFSDQDRGSKSTTLPTKPHCNKALGRNGIQSRRDANEQTETKKHTSFKPHDCSETKRPTFRSSCDTRSTVLSLNQTRNLKVPCPDLQNKEMPKIANNEMSPTNYPTKLTDTLGVSQTERCSKGDCVVSSPSRDRAPRTPISTMENTVPKSRHLRKTDNTATKTFIDTLLPMKALPNCPPKRSGEPIPTKKWSKTATDAILKKQTSERSSSLIQKMNTSKQPFDLSTRTQFPRCSSDTKPKPLTPNSLRREKQIANVPSLKSNVESRTHTPQSPRILRAKRHTPSSLADYGIRTSAQKSIPQGYSDYENTSLKPRKGVAEKHEVSPSHNEGPNQRYIKAIDVEPRITSSRLNSNAQNSETQLFVSLSSTATSQDNYTSKQMQMSDINNGVFCINQMIKHEHSEFNNEMESSGNYTLPGKPGSSCSYKINEVYSLSSTSMLPAMGSYEDKDLFPTSCRTCDDYIRNTYPAREMLPPISRLGYQCVPETLARVSEPPTESLHKLPSSTKESTANENIIYLNDSSFSLASQQKFNQMEDTKEYLQVDGGKRHEGEQNCNNTDKITLSTIEWKSRSVSCTELSSFDKYCDVVEYRHQQSGSEHLTEQIFSKKSQEFTGVAGEFFPLTTDESGNHEVYSAASIAVDRLSLENDTESSCQVYTQSDIGLDHEDVSHEISSMTNAISCISSIPEDTSPRSSYSNSSTYQVRLEELSSDSLAKGSKTPICSDTYAYRYCDHSFWPSASYPIDSSDENNDAVRNFEPKVAFNETCEVKMVQLEKAGENESSKRSHERSIAAMHVSCDTSISPTLSIQAKCNHCGTYRTGGAGICQPLANCRHDHQSQKNKFYAFSNWCTCCGRCCACSFRDKFLNKDRWSQLSSATISSSASTLHQLYHEKNLDRTTVNSRDSTANVYVDHCGFSCALRRTNTTERTPTTPTLAFPCINMSQQSLLHNGHIPSVSSSWKVLNAYYKAPPIKMFSGTVLPQLPNERVHKNDHWGRSNPSARLGVASFWPTIPTAFSRSSTLAVNKVKPLQIKCQNPGLSLSPIYTISMPQDVVTKATSRAFNKGIILQ